MASVWQQFVDIKTGIDKRNSIIVLRTHDKTDNARINVLKRSIRRAWTINGLPDYWDAVRKSTTIRIYRSLPLNRNERKKIQDSAGRNLSMQTLGVMKKDSPIVVYHDDSKRKEKTLKHGERRSNIPIFRRNSQEFEDLCNLREQPKRSTVTTIPQRYRGSADDLRRYRDDSNLPSHIPKLLFSSRHKENKTKKLVVESKEHTAKLSIYPKGSVKKSNTMSTTVEQDYTKIGDKSLRSKLVTNETIVFNNSREHSDVLNLSVTPVEKEAIIDIVVEEQPFDVNNVHHKCDSENVAAGKSQQIDEPLQRKHLKDELLTEEREDETRTRRPSSHLSPEASPLSTRSSKYSPRESESEPTPGLPRKISGSDTCVSSQRIRDAITRTRRESNSSTRCESSGSDSIRLSESSLHDYTDLARRVRLFGNNYYCPRTTSVESDELVPRDSATSAGEDESHEDCLLRDPSRYPSASSSSSSQGRTMLRRRRQFDSQGSRRRGKSHARSCCSDEFLNLQIARHPSPLRSGYKTIDGQEPPNPDYRRLVFISSDSSSGREEDDADSSCSSSSYLNGLPRNSHAQSLEDCDWDYFESNSLPLPSALSDGLRSHYTAAHVKDSGRDWDCCLGRGSGACLACGGSPGRNVLPVPVPIPVPVPYPVPIPASLWTHGNFVAAESSMIAATTTTTTTTTIISTTTVAAATTTTAGNEASLTVKNIPTAAVPWFTWHPQFHQPEVHGASGGNRMSSRFIANAFDPSNFTFQYYGTIQEYKNFILSASESLKFDNEKMPDIYSRDLTTTTTITTTTTSTTKTTSITAIKTMMTTATTMTPSTNTTATISGINCHNVVSDEKLTNNLETESFSKKIAILTDNVPYNENNDDKIVSMNDNLNSNDILEPVNENLNDDNYCVSRSDWNSSSGRSSADSSDFEESSSHRFSRIFVVNDDSLVSDNDDVDDIEDIHGLTDENQAHEATTSIDDSYFHKRVITLSDEEPIILQQVKSFCKKPNVVAKCNKNEVKHIERSEIYVGDSVDTSDSCVKLQSIRSINPDEANDNYSNIIDPDEFNMKRSSGEMKSFDLSVTPDSLELIDAITIIDNDTLDYKSMNILDEQMSMSLDTSKEIEKIDDLYTNVDANKSTESTKADKKIEIVPMEFFSVSQAIDSAKNKIITEIVSEDENMKKCEFTTTKIPEIYREIDNINSIKQERTITTEMTIERGVKGEIGEEYLDGQQVRESQHNGGVCCGGNNTCDNGGKCVATRGMARYRSVERRPPTRKENVLLTTISNAEKDQSTNITNNLSTNNKYKSLVMITQDGYQPVSVVTTNTTTLTLQSSDVESTQGLAGYYHLALEALTEPQLRKGQGPRRPLMVKRTTTALITNNEHETDSGLSVGSASESESSTDKYRVINKDSKNRIEDEIKFSVEKSSSSSTSSVLPQSNETNGLTGIVILEEGLADDDSWVEEVSHDEDEQSATTATEESSEDESNNIGDREEELRGYHRQAIDFTLHTIVEESCEESEAEPSLGSKNSRRMRPPSASDLEKYFFFGLGGDNINNSSTANRNGDSNMNLNNGNSIDNGKSGIAQEVDSLSETSSVYSEVLESLGQDDLIFNKETTNDDFTNSSRLEKYFLSEFLGFDKDRRDSDGSVGSDSEGRPSPEAQRRKRLVRARGTGRSHSSSLDNLLALTQSNQNLSTQNSQQDLSMNQDSQDTQSEDSSTENDGMDDGQTAVFGADGQYDTVKRKKKKPRNLGSQSPRIVEDRNKSPEIRDGSVKSSETSTNENDIHLINSDDCRDDNENGIGVGNYSDHIVNELNENNDVINGDVGAEDDSKISESEALHAVSIANTSNASSSSHADDRQNVNDSALNRNKQQLRDSGFIGSCDDLLHPKSSIIDNKSDGNAKDLNVDNRKTRDNSSHTINKILQTQNNLPPPIANTSLSRKDSFNNWSSDEETNLMMSKMRQFFKTMVANSNGSTTPVSNNSNNNNANNNSSAPSPLPSPRSSEYTSAKSRHNRTKPPQLVYFENELTRLMKTVPGIRDDQVREIVEYLSSEDTWSDSYDSSDYTSSDLEGAAGGRRSALQEQISQSCQQIINKFNIASNGCRKEEETSLPTNTCVGRDTAFVYQKLVQSFTKIASDSVSSDASSTPHSSPPLIAKVMHHIGSRLVALMHQVSEGNSSVPQHSSSWRRYSQHHRAPSSASTTEDDDSTSDSPHTPSSNHFQLPRSKSHDPLLYINGHPATTVGQEGEEREASDYERFSWRGSFESALMTADSRTKLSLLACSGDINASASVSALAMAAKRRSAGDLLFNPKSFSREQLDRVRSCGSIGGGNSPVVGAGTSTSAVTGIVGSIGEKIWSNHRRSSVPDANTRGGSGASAGDDDTEDELEYPGDPKATTLPRGLTAISSANAATNSLPRLPVSNASATSSTIITHSPMHKAQSMYHFLPQHTGVKSARYRPPGFARNSSNNSGVNSAGNAGPKRAFSAPGLQIAGSHNQQLNVKRDREISRSRRREQTISLMPDDGGSLSEACSTPIIGGTSPRLATSRTIIDIDDVEHSGIHSSVHHHGNHANTRASLSNLGARSDSLASVYSGAGEGRWCGSVAVRGEVEFSLQYDYKQLTFQVHVNQCKDLAPVDIKRNRSDPYVKVYLLPDKSKGGKRKTKVKKHTLNPVFDETLKFHMNLNGLETRTLWLTVWHSDMFGRNDFLGEVRMSLENKIFDDPTPRWYPLQERTEPFYDPITYKGEVIVGLKFVPPDPTQSECEREVGSLDRASIGKSKKNLNRGALHVLVKEARNLQTRTKNSGTCDPFCKSYLLPDKGRAGKQKTHVVRRSGGSPVWNHTFIYKNVSLQELAERGLELTVWDHDRIASNEFLGGVRFNLGTGKNYGKSVDWMDATGRELSLWQSMLERPNFWVEGAVTLRPNLHNHGRNSAP